MAIWKAVVAIPSLDSECSVMAFDMADGLETRPILLRHADTQAVNSDFHELGNVTADNALFNENVVKAIRGRVLL